MQLAPTPITIELNGEAYALRPSLRAAYQLERRHTYAGTLTAIAETNLNIIADLVELGSGDRDARYALAYEIDRNGVAAVARLRLALTAFLAALIGADEGEADQPAEQSQSALTYAAFYDRLFAIGSGWLGWTPEETWNATPAEILAAHQGRIDLLQAIFGSPDKGTTAERTHRYSADQLREVEKQDFDPSFDRNAFDALKANVMGGA